jgi:predicted GH43/DUF377 family glycosyl hydrolase
MFTRHPLNPLINPENITPSRPGWQVLGTFNAGAAQWSGDTILLVRVAERPQPAGGDWIACPVLDEHGEIVLRHIRRTDPDWDCRDPRMVRQRSTGAVYLTSISHIRRARSTDGVHFTIDAQPWLAASTTLEAFGVEDARITLLDDRAFINYSAVSPHGIATMAASTTDFEQMERHGVLFPPSNRDVTVFPEQINGLYMAYHRPMPGEFGLYSMWLASSPDLVHWGGHRVVLDGVGGWEAGRVGGGAPPIWTPDGWLVIYHAADRSNRYCLGAFLAAHDDPSRILSRAVDPILAPEAAYEIDGFFGNVVFTCGALLEGDRLRVYYGAADERVALAEAPLGAVLERLRATS